MEAEARQQGQQNPAAANELTLSGTSEIMGPMKPLRRQSAVVGERRIVSQGIGLAGIHLSGPVWTRGRGFAMAVGAG